MISVTSTANKPDVARSTLSISKVNDKVRKLGKASLACSLLGTAIVGLKSMNEANDERKTSKV
jgi:hypothetical protein